VADSVPAPAGPVARAASLLRDPGAPTWHLVLAGWLDTLARDAAGARTENGILRLGLCDDPPCIRYAADLADAYLREYAPATQVATGGLR